MKWAIHLTLVKEHGRNKLTADKCSALNIPKLKANPLVHQDETRALLTSETGEQSKGKFQKDWHKDPSRESYINKMDRWYMIALWKYLHQRKLVIIIFQTTTKHATILTYTINNTCLYLVRHSIDMSESGQRHNSRL